jgi:hypothetical protein
VVHEEIKSILNSGNALYHSVQNFVFSSAVYKCINSSIQKYNFPVVVYGCETWSMILGKELRMKVFENRVPRRLSVPKRDEVIGGWRKLH